MLAADLRLLSILQPDGAFLNPGQKLSVAPSELTFVFNDGQVIDPNSLAAIKLTASGLDGTFGNANDVSIAPGFLGLTARSNEVVMRFAERLVDDVYQILIAGSGPNPLSNDAGTPFNNGVDVTQTFELDLGAQVVAVAPQPVRRDAGGNLVQDTSQIVVYFNNDDLDPAAAQNPAFYQLIDTKQTSNPLDDVLTHPMSVSYDPATDTAVLDFGAPLAAGTYRLRIGNNDSLPVAPLVTNVAADIVETNSSFDSAFALGTLGPASRVISSSIDPQFFGPSLPGAINEPGHRDIDISVPRESHLNAGADSTSGITTAFYNFQDVYGTDPQGNVLHNVITSAQKQRAREVLELYGHFLGIKFIETASSGLTIVTGDLRAISPTVPTGPGGVVGISDGSLSGRVIMDAAENWGNSEYGGDWFRTAMHEIGHSLGLGHAYDLPSLTLMGQTGGSGEPVFPGDNDLVHGEFRFRPDSKDIDLYRFEVPQAGVLAAETFAERLTTSGAADRLLLDSVLTLYEQFQVLEVPSNGGAGLADGDTFTIVQDLGGGTFRQTTFEFDVGNGVAPGNVAINFNSSDAPSRLARKMFAAVTSAEAGLSVQAVVNGRRLELHGLVQASESSGLNLFVDRSVIARNDDYFSSDSLIRLEVQPGVYYVAVTSTGNTDFDPTIRDSGFGGTTQGPYELHLDFHADPGATLVDATGTMFDGDANGTPGGTFNFWFQAGSTLFVDRANDLNPSSPEGDGSLANPYDTISSALAVAQPGDIVRIVGNGGADGNLSTPGDNLPYLVGLDDLGRPLRDGAEMLVPRGVNVMIDAGAVLKLRRANIDVGTSAPAENRSEGAVQMLGTPGTPVLVTSYRNDAIGGDSDGPSAGPAPGDWGGLVYRADSDHEDHGIFLNYVAQTDLSFGGGEVIVNSVKRSFSSIHLVAARPTILRNTITNTGVNADAAISADPPSFEETRFVGYDRVGPDIDGNRLLNNTVNGIFVRVLTPFSSDVQRLDVAARWDDTDIVYVVSETLFIKGTPGGPEVIGGTRVARLDGGLVVDPGVIVKLDGARIETEIGAQLIAEGQPGRDVVFTSLHDDSYGAGGTFDTTGDGSAREAAPGDWGGLFFWATSKGNLDHATIRFAGGVTPIEGGFEQFNAVEIHQAQVRIANSTIESNAGGTTAPGQTDPNRNGRGTNANATIFVRGAQPVIVGNTFGNNIGATIDINANSLNTDRVTDPGRATGRLQPITRYGDDLRTTQDNRGPLIRFNRIGNNRNNDATDGLVVRGGVLTTESIWDDADIVHVVFDEIVSVNEHTVGGLRLQSSPTESLVVKLQGDDAGFTASGMAQEIDDRIGGTVQIVGTPGHPVVLTSLADDSVGAGLDPDGNPVTDTNNDGEGSVEQKPSFPPSGGEITVTSTGNGMDLVNAMLLRPLPASVQIASAVYSGGDGVNNPFGAGTYVNGDGVPLEILQKGAIITTGDEQIPQTNTSPGFTGVLGTGPDADLDALIAGSGFSTTEAAVLQVTIHVDALSGVKCGLFDFQFGSDEFSEFVGTPFNDVLGGFINGGAATNFMKDSMGNLISINSAFFDLDNENPPFLLDIEYDGMTSGLTASFPLQPGDNLLKIAVGDASDTILDSGILMTDLRFSTKTCSGVVERSQAAAAGDWRSVRLAELSNDRNVAVAGEAERTFTLGDDTNAVPADAQFLGDLAPDEKSGDDNLRLGFEVHGAISLDDPGDVDVYSFTAAAGTEVWFDIDRTDIALDTVLELVDVRGNVLARSVSNTDLQSFLADAMPMLKDSFVEDDFGGANPADAFDLYTTNPRDAGMRVVLPGPIPGERQEYFIRVRSNSPDLSDLDGGLTRGEYQLQIRLRQVDEFPGSTVRNSDIRFSASGIEVLGQPSHSPLAGESADEPGDSADEGFGAAQDVGNLLAVDRNTLSIGGALATRNDVDWYRFTVDYTDIQAIGGVNSGIRSFATLFDLDYADGLSRADTTLAVFDENGNLILLGTDSDVVEDQPAPTEGADTNDLSRGTFGKRDPYIGTVQLPAGVEPAGSSQTYFVAVFSNALLPAVLNQLMVSSASAPLTRVEPANSLQRIVEDHVGFTGYGSGRNAAVPVLPNGSLFDGTSAQSLATHAVSFKLSDVVLFVTTGGELFTVDPFTGATETDVTGPNANLTPGILGDIATRPDGFLYGVSTSTRNLPINDANTGNYILLDTGNGAETIAGDDGIATTPNTIGSRFQAITFRQNDIGQFDGFGANNRGDLDPTTIEVALWRFDQTTGAVIDENPNAPGLQPFRPLPPGRDGDITGLAFARPTGGTLFGVDQGGNLWNMFSLNLIRQDVTGTGAGFTGLARGPQNVQNGAFANTLFATASNGRMYAFDFSGNLRVVFDTNGDGMADSTSVPLQLAGTTGLAFSTLDYNLWHPTLQRRSDPGHGIAAAFDNSRNDLTEAEFTINGQTVNQAEGGVSFYFGLENPNDPIDQRTLVSQADALNYSGTNGVLYDTYNLPGGAKGSLVTNPFSLEGYAGTDLPTLYFTYFLQTQDANSGTNQMRDAFRVQISSDGGLTWNMLATNNSVRSQNLGESELPAYASLSADAASDPRQRIQELFDNTGGWRQARIDLRDFVGDPNLILRFDFTTSGVVDGRTPGDEFGNDGLNERGQNDAFEGVYIDDVIIGFAERGEVVTASNGQTSFFSVPQNPRPGAPSQVLQGPYQLEIRRGTEVATNNNTTNSDIFFFQSLDTNDRLTDALTLFAPPGNSLVDGQAFSISDGVHTISFEFDSGGGVSPGLVVPIPFGGSESPAQMGDRIAAAINSAHTLFPGLVPPYTVRASSIPSSNKVEISGAVGLSAMGAGVNLTATAAVKTVSETAGAGATTVTVRREGSTAATLNFTLFAVDPTTGGPTDEVALGGSGSATFSGTIPAGSSFVTLAVDAIDDLIADGTQPVLLRAVALGFQSVTDVLDVSDNEVAALTVSITGPTSIVEPAGAVGGVTTNVLWVGPDSLGFNDGTFNITQVTVGQFASLDFSGFDVVYVDSNAGGLATLQSRAADIASFVGAGGGLVAENGGSDSAPDFSWVPNAGAGLTWQGATDDNLTITPTGITHPVTAGLTNAGLSSWFNSQHNNFPSVAGMDVLVVDSTGTANLLADEFGAGRLVYLGSDASDHQPTGQTEQLIRQALAWAGNQIVIGGPTTTAIVTRNTPTDQPLEVFLQSMDPSEAVVQPSVIIPAGSTSASFLIGSVQDSVRDGNQTAAIRAFASGLRSGTANVEIVDLVAEPELAVAVAADFVLENAGSAATTGTITREGDTSAALNVTLSALDPFTGSLTDEVTLNGTGLPTINLTIPAGMASISFNVDVVDDLLSDGTQAVVFAASATGYVEIVDLLDVRDNELPPQWIPQGPSPATGGQVEGLTAQGNPVVGAVHTVLADPTDGNTIYVGAANGGIWRTTNATAPSGPSWEPLTDDQESLSIGALAFDPADPTFQTIVAGLGHSSSFYLVGEALTGLLITTDGGNTWSPLGQADLSGRNITGVAPRGNTIVVSANAFGGGSGEGVYRSIDGGASFQLVSGTNGLAAGPAFDLVGDPGNPNRLYAGIGGATPGIFRSDDAGATWTNVANVAQGALLGATTNNIEFAVHNNATLGTNAVYVGIVNNGQLVGIFRSADQGGTWATMDLPQTLEGGVPVGIHPFVEPGGQGSLHFSMVADPNNPTILYVGGDRQPSPLPNSVGANDFSGRLFRGDASIAPTGAVPSPQWSPLTHVGTTNNSAPHADSRDMIFNAAGNLIEVDDGGIYQRSSPTSANGIWTSLIGNLQVTEFHDIAYDSNSNIIIGGAQDTGTSQQTSTGSRVWQSVSTADGGDVAVDDVTLAAVGQSIRYSSFQFLGGFARRTYDAANNLLNQVFPALAVQGGGAAFVGQFVTPLQLNAINPTRLVLGGGNSVYESLDQGDTITEIGPGIVVNSSNLGSPIAYGGMLAGVANPDVLYVGSGNSVFLRSTSGGTLNKLPTYPGGTVTDIVLDPDDWRHAIVSDPDDVWMTIDGGSSWQNITGNLGSLTDLSLLSFRSLAYAVGTVADSIFLGAAGGVFQTLSTALGTWQHYGIGLPNAMVWDLDHDVADDVLLAGTLGRGAWTTSATSGSLGTLAVTFNTSVAAEDSGATVLATITRAGGDLSQPLVVTLTNSDPTELAAPSSVMFPANVASLSVALSVLDDFKVDGTKTATVFASADGFNSGSDSLQVTDNDTKLAVSDNVNVSGPSGNLHGEVSIAVNPNNPLNLIATAVRNPTVDTANNILTASQDLVWFSTDGGLTWTQSTPGDPVGGADGGDPSVVFDRFGNAYFAHRDINFGVVVARSTNGGQTWSAPVVVPLANPTNDPANLTSPYLAVGPNASNLAQDRIYVGYHVSGVARINSSLNGLVWQATDTVVSPTGNGTGAQISVGTAGELYYVWENFATGGEGTVVLNTSLDGGQTWSGDLNIYTSNVNVFNDPFAGGVGLDAINERGNDAFGDYEVPAQPQWGIATRPTIAVDRSGGPNTGTIYVALTDQGDLDGDPDATNPADHHDTDIFLIRSTDGGLTWSSPLRVNDDTTNHSQILPWLAVDQETGNVAVAWYDARDDANNDEVAVYASVSLDGGASFQPSVRVAQELSGQTFIDSTTTIDAFDFGDYLGLDFDEGLLHVAWADNGGLFGTGPQNQQVFYSTVALVAEDVTLRLDIAADAIPENGGSTTATITRSGGRIDLPLVVSISAIDPTTGLPTDELIVQTAVIIPANQTSITVNIFAVDDLLADGSQPVVITARGFPYDSIGDSVDVLDNETPTLVLTVSPTTIAENAGAAAAFGTVTRNTPTDEPLVVFLISSDTSEATVPSTVVIPAGASLVSFPISAVDELISDGSRLVTIFGAVRGYRTGEDTLTVVAVDNVDSFERLGDKNLQRQQGQIIIESNVIRNSGDFGINVDAGARTSASNRTHAGPVMNTPTLNNGRLVPGVTIENNVISGFGTAGIRFSGDPDSGGPLAPVTFGRINNNTVFSNAGTGILVENNASPTILNNIVSTVSMGISIDASSRSLPSPPIVGTTLYHAIPSGQETNFGNLGTFAIVLAGTEQLFLDAQRENFYLASGVPAIDSSLNALVDRPGFVAVKSPLGIPASPILAPERDVFGQLRVDDPSQDPPPGLGSNIFKDRGAIERADFTGPRAILVNPADDPTALALVPTSPDLLSDANVVVVNATFPLKTFQIQLLDDGSGIDDSSVVPERFTLERDGTVLTEGTDYTFRYNPFRDLVELISTDAVFASGAYTILLHADGDPSDRITDIAGAPLEFPNPHQLTVIIDTVAPEAMVASPEDGGPDDAAPAPDVVVVTAAQNEIVLRISDPQGGLDHDTVALAATPNIPVFALALTQDLTPRGSAPIRTLVLDTDYTFSYSIDNAKQGTITLTPTPGGVLAGSFSDALYTITLGDGVPGGLKDITDLAENVLANPVLVVNVREVGVPVTETGGSTDVAEQGPTSDTYSIVLTSEPTDDVLITLSFDAAQISTDKPSLTFTKANWDVPQTVTVTAVDDVIPEPAIHTTVITHTATSTDVLYNGVAIASVTVNIEDNDVPPLVTGVKFEDLNGNGVKDPGEPGLGGWTIFLDANSSGVLDAGEPATVTAADGTYALDVPTLGTVTIAEVLQPDWFQTAPPGGTYTVVTTAAGQVFPGRDFGNFRGATIAGRKFKDDNRDGVQNAGELGLPGWTIFLDGNGNGVLDTGETSILTDAAGDYQFTGLGPDTYTVAEVIQPGWVQTSPIGAHTILVNSSGAVFSGINFGNFQELNFGAEFAVNSIVPGSQRFSSIGMAPDGSFVATWAGPDASDLGIFARRFNAAGQPLGPDFPVNTFTNDRQWLPSVAVDALGRFAITWTSFNQDGTPRSVYARRFAADGTPQGGEFRVNTLNAGFQTNSQIAMSTGGNFIINWTSFADTTVAGDVFARRFDANGNSLGDQYKVNTFANAGQGESAAAMDPDGNVVFVWTSFTQDGSDGGVFGQLFDANDQKVGGEFQINEFNSGRQSEPDVAMNPGGGFVASWTSIDQDGSGRGVFARAYNALGLPRDGVFPVNSFTAGDQRDSAIATDAHGNTTIVWTSAGQDGSGTGVFAQRFNVVGERVGGEFQVNSITSGDQDEPAIAMDPNGNATVIWSGFDASGRGIRGRQVQVVTTPTPEVTVFADGTKLVDDNPAPIDFGTGVLGVAGPTQTFTVRNDGTVPLTASSLLIPSGFLLVEGLASNVAPGQTDTFTVALDTASEGARAGEIRFLNNDEDENPFNIQVSGVVETAEPEITVLFGTTTISDGASTSIDFGTVVEGQTGPQRVFTVRNDGAGPLNLSGLLVPAGYTVIEGLVATLGSGASDTFTVRLDSATVGTKSGDVSFGTNDADENPFNFAVTGTVEAAPTGSAEITVLYEGTAAAGSSTQSTTNIADGSTQPINFGTVGTGGSAAKHMFRVRNDGNADLTLSSLVLPDGFVLVEGLVAKLGPGQSDTFQVKLNEGMLGKHTGQIKIGNNDQDENPFDFMISGTVMAGSQNPVRFSGGMWSFDLDGAGGAAEKVFAFGVPGDVPVTGDWNNDGTDDVAVFRNGIWFFDLNGAGGAAEKAFAFGMPGDVPIAGDFNADGKTDVGVFRNGIWFFDLNGAGGAAEKAFAFGIPGDRPVAGDFNGDGRTDAGVFRNGIWYLDLNGAGGAAESAYAFGVATDVPVAGDFNGNGTADAGVYRDGIWFFDLNNRGGAAERALQFGAGGDVPLAARQAFVAQATSASIASAPTGSFSRVLTAPVANLSDTDPAAPDDDPVGAALESLLQGGTIQPAATDGTVLPTDQQTLEVLSADTTAHHDDGLSDVLGDVLDEALLLGL